jgi:hypothetical protein
MSWIKASCINIAFIHSCHSVEMTIIVLHFTTIHDSGYIFLFISHGTLCNNNKSIELVLYHWQQEQKHSTYLVWIASMNQRGQQWITSWQNVGSGVCIPLVPHSDKKFTGGIKFQVYAIMDSAWIEGFFLAKRPTNNIYYIILVKDFGGCHLW